MKNTLNFLLRMLFQNVNLKFKELIFYTTILFNLVNTLFKSNYTNYYNH